MQNVMTLLQQKRDELAKKLQESVANRDRYQAVLEGHSRDVALFTEELENLETAIAVLTRDAAMRST
jgi:hypothetical protein